MASCPVTRAILHGAFDLRLEQGELPADKGRIADTLVTALSTGTDLGNYLGRSEEVPGAPGYPRGIGYSNVAVLRDTGRRVFSMKPHQSAYLAADTDLLIDVPDGVSSEQASLAYLAQLGVAAMRQAGYQAGERVAVVGLGVIGLATVGLARAMGAAVTAVANSPLRAAAALQVGAQTALSSEEAAAMRDSVDLVILTANSWAAYRTAVNISHIGGRVAILGFPGRGEPLPDFNPLDARWLYAKQLTLMGSGFSPRTECPRSEIPFNLRRNLEFILHAMASGTVNLEPLITHRLPASRMTEAYELARHHSKELVAAVFDWQNA